MAKKSYFLNDDIQFHFKNTINWGHLIPLYEDLDENFNLDQAIDMYNDTLKVLGTIAANELEESAVESDKSGVEFADGGIVVAEGITKALKAFKKAEALALNTKPEYGGVGMPGTIHMVNIEMISMADPAFMTVYAFYSGVSKTLEVFGSEEIKKKYIPLLVKGDYGGSMSLTEPDAGSDLGNIRTTAEKKNDHWEISGNKIFITNGGGELTLVLARSDKESTGTKGLSMFLVPRFIEKDGKKVKNFSIETIEHKLGIRASPTCELLFDKSIGYLVGEEGAGLKQMFFLMNEARLGVSVQALGIAQKAFDEAKEYASERVQFGKPIIQHELIADKLFDMETDIKAMRSFIYKACEYEDLKEGYRNKLEKQQDSKQNNSLLNKKHAKYKYLARDMIPIVKYFATEKSIQIARDSLQIHGGNGYTTDYPAEMHVRDSIITTIYEGTSQIQALMAMNDTLKRSKIFPFVQVFTNLGKRIGCIFTSSLKRKVVKAEIQFSKAVCYLKRPFIFAKLFGNKKKEKAATSYAMLCAERLTRLKAYMTIMKILVDEASRFKQRKWVARRFIRNYLPEIKKESKIIRSGDKDTLKAINA